MPQKNEFLWSDAYLIIAEQNFESCFEKLYENEFVDYIFPKYDSRIDKATFVKAIAGDAESMP